MNTMEASFSRIQIVPTFRVKRPHKKSRLGCKVCKKRRVKCDESRPACERCRSRGLQCAYPNLQTEVAIRPGSREATASSATSPHTPSTDASSESLDSPQELPPSVDAELAQHYLRHTAVTLASTCSNSFEDNVWTVVIPALAFTYPAIRSGMLALSALCNYFDSLTETRDSEAYLGAALHYGEQCLQQHSMQIRDMENPDLDSILGCTRILMTAGLAFFRVHRETGVTLSDPESWTWLGLMRGIIPIQIALGESADLKEMMIRHDMNPTLPPMYRKRERSKVSEAVGYEHPYFRVLQTWRKDALPSLSSALDETYAHMEAQQVENCRQAIKVLDGIIDYICSNDVCNVFRAAFTWPVQIPVGYVELLIGGDAFARIIYTHWLTLTILVENLWWVGDMGVASLLEIAGNCSSGSPELLGLLAWPERMLQAREIKKQ